MKTSWWSRNLEAVTAALFPLRVLLFSALVPIQLRLRRLPDLPAWLEPKGEVPPPLPPEAVENLVRRIDRLLAAGRPLVRPGCLTRGVTLFYFLRRAGADVSLRFGVGTVRGRFAAHCWVAYQGQPLAEKRDPRGIYTETWGIEPSTAQA